MYENSIFTIEFSFLLWYIDDGIGIKVPKGIQKEIINDFKYMLSLKEEGINLFFTDIDKIKKIMLEELNK